MWTSSDFVSVFCVHYSEQTVGVLLLLQSLWATVITLSPEFPCRISNRLLIQVEFPCNSIISASGTLASSTEDSG